MRRKYKKIIVPTAIIAIATIVIICLPIVGFSAAIASGKYDVAHSIYDSNSGNASFCAQAQNISQKRSQTAFSALKNGKIGNEEYQAIAQGCCMEHTWKEADCSFPKRCSKCGKTDGEALGHSWIEATCTTAKTCSICGQIDGSPKGHVYDENSNRFICTECGSEKVFFSVDLDEMFTLAIDDYAEFKSKYIGKTIRFKGRPHKIGDSDCMNFIFGHNDDNSMEVFLLWDTNNKDLPQYNTNGSTAYITIEAKVGSITHLASDLYSSIFSDAKIIPSD